MGLNHIAFHDLHVVDVIKNFEPFRADPFLQKLDPPFGVVPHANLDGSPCC